MQEIETRNKMDVLLRYIPTLQALAEEVLMALKTVIEELRSGVILYSCLGLANKIRYRIHSCIFHVDILECQSQKK